MTCEYFLKRSQKMLNPEDAYPYAHLLADNDLHMEGLSRNGQYRCISEVYPTDKSTLRTYNLQECIRTLADQNNVRTFICKKQKFYSLLAIIAKQVWMGCEYDL